MLPGREPITDIPAAAPTLRIGQLAKLASVHVETLRYYEREGLLDKPYQHLSGYRAYPASAVAHVQSIKRAQALGFTLTEIRRLLKSSRGERVSSEASKKLAEIDATMADLQRARAELLRLVEYGCDRLVGCTCGQADCPTSIGPAEAATASRPEPGLQAVPAKRSGLLAGALLAAGCAACCAPFVGAALAAIGVPALAATEGLEVGLGATAFAAGGIALNRIRQRARTQPVRTGTASKSVAIACTLPAAAVGDRETEWRSLLDNSLVDAERIPSGVRITVQPGAAAELNRLIDLERGCCAWMRFDFAAPEAVAITADGEGADVLAAMFLRREPSNLTRPGTS